MSKLTKNIYSNFFGSFLISFANLIAIPKYISFLGLANYGIVGIYTTLYYLILTFIEFGFGVALSREVAKKNNNFYLVPLLFTYEKIYLAFSLLIFCILIIFERVILSSWQINIPENTYIFICCTLISRCMVSLYGAFLNGVQKNEIYNITVSIAEVSRILIIVSVFEIYGASTSVFFIIQFSMNSLTLVTLYMITWKVIGETNPFKYIFEIDVNILAQIKSFLRNTTFIYILAGIITQIDKIFLVRFVEEEEFASYVTVSVLVFSLGKLVTPIFSTTVPALAEAYTEKNTEKFTFIMHKSSQLITLLIVPVSLYVCFYSEQLIMFWTNNIMIVTFMGIPMKIFMVGMLLNGFFHQYYATTLALKEDKLILWHNIVALIIQCILLPLLLPLYGLKASAVIWVLVNCIYFFVTPHFIQSSYFRVLKKDWYLFDILYPLIAATSTAFLCYFTFMYFTSNIFIEMLTFMTFVGLSTLISIKDYRQKIHKILCSIVSKRNIFKV